MNTNFKNSGIAWIGQIPKHWEVIRNKYILSGLYSGGTPTSGTAKFYTDEDYGIPFVSIGDMSKKEFIESTKTKITKFGILDKNLKILPKNTILYSIYATIGEVAELKCSATISQALLALFVKNSYNKQFYKYNLKAMKDYIFFESSGTTQFNLNAKKVLNFSFVSPPLNEQKKIAEFLDKKCEIIDKRLSNLERKIKSLKEYKKSLISECVTKGLNPKNIEFKDSGIPWIGQIPKHWEVTKIKYCLKENFGGCWGDDLENEQISQNSRLCIRVADFDFDKQKVKQTADTFRNYTKSQILSTKLQDGDLIIEKSGGGDKMPVGRSVVFEQNLFGAKEVLFANFCQCFRPLNINNKFFAHAMKAFYQNNNMRFFFNQTTGIQNLSIFNILNAFLPYPPLNEQKKIAEFLDKKCEIIDKRLGNLERKIKSLKEYKKSLIYECVTGKKEI